MKKISDPIVFFGNERIATGIHTDTPLLHALLEAGYNIVAIVANYERGKSRNVRELEIAQLAEHYDIPLLLPEKLADITEELRNLHATAGVLVAYGQLIPQAIIDLFPYGIINIHPSLLPKHRGPTPLESVILDGSTLSGVSVMKLVKAMDAGPVYAQSEVALTGKETKQELADSLLAVSSAMLVELLPEILSGAVVALPQDDSAATYDKLILKEDGVLDWHKSATQLEREVRAYLDWPKSRTIIGDKDVVITKSHVKDGNDTVGKIWKEAKSFGFYTTSGILVIDELKPAGKQAMSAEAFLAGYGTSL